VAAGRFASRADGRRRAEPQHVAVAAELIEALGRVVLAARPERALLVVQYERRVVVFRTSVLPLLFNSGPS
jgi:hypothetical protein